MPVLDVHAILGRLSDTREARNASKGSTSQCRKSETDEKWKLSTGQLPLRTKNALRAATARDSFCEGDLDVFTSATASASTTAIGLLRAPTASAFCAPTIHPQHAWALVAFPMPAFCLCVLCVPLGLDMNNFVRRAESVCDADRGMIMAGSRLRIWGMLMAASAPPRSPSLLRSALRVFFENRQLICKSGTALARG